MILNIKFMKQSTKSLDALTLDIGKARGNHMHKLSAHIFIRPHIVTSHNTVFFFTLQPFFNLAVYKLMPFEFYDHNKFPQSFYRSCSMMSPKYKHLLLIVEGVLISP
jgi:hypothetical protein